MWNWIRDNFVSPALRKMGIPAPSAAIGGRESARPAESKTQMLPPDLSQTRNAELDHLLIQLASDDPVTHKSAHDRLEKLCYPRWPRLYMLGSEVGLYLDAQEK